jgi:hypothetical protein
MPDGSMVQMSDAPNLRPGFRGRRLRGGEGAARPESAPETAPKMAESAPKRGAPETHARARPLRGEEPSGRPEDRGGPSGPPRLRGGSVEQGSGAVVRMDRQIVLEDQPAPFVTTEAQVAQWVGAAAAGDADARLSAFEAWDRRRGLLRDTLAALRERRRITAHELRAGQEIAMVVEWQSGAFAPIVRSQFRERLADDAYAGGGGLWLSLLEVEHTRYAPWREWADAYPVKVGKTLRDLTLLVVADGLGIRQASDALRMDQRRALRLLRRSLHRYCALAGWQMGEGPPSIETA